MIEAIYEDESNTTVAATIDGERWTNVRLDTPGHLANQVNEWIAGGGVVSSFVPTAPHVSVPQTISDRQFFQQLAIEGIVTQAEALAAVKTGAVPAALQAFIGSMPEEDRFGAEMIVSGGTTFERSHPLTIGIGAAYGMAPADIDDFFIAAGAL